MIFQKIQQEQGSKFNNDDDCTDIFKCYKTARFLMLRMLQITFPSF